MRLRAVGETSETTPHQSQQHPTAPPVVPQAAAVVRDGTMRHRCRHQYHLKPELQSRAQPEELALAAGERAGTLQHYQRQSHRTAAETRREMRCHPPLCKRGQAVEWQLEAAWTGENHYRCCDRRLCVGYWLRE